MKQILQNLGNGETLLAEVAAPGVRAGCVLVETEASLVSLGTEKMLVDFGRAGWIARARKQPEKVKQVLQKIKTDGLFPTIDAVQAKLAEPVALGYCNAGRVIAVGEGVNGFAVGDSVVSNGPHAEVVCVPKNLCAKVPEGVSAEEAVFTVLGSIGLQGVRLFAPTLGDSVVVTGLGLIGLVVVQLLTANGCRVLGVDFDAQKCALARTLGAEVVNLGAGEDPLAVAAQWSGGRGVDGVIITASTQSSEPVSQAAQMCRKRGRIVLVGVTGLELNRAEFYEKELTFQVSCSYGPGRYDEEYEQGGRDYPLGFVRWTEQRNFEAILELLAAKKLNTGCLVSHRFAFEQALEAYAVVGGGKALGIVLNYAQEEGKESAAVPQKFLRTVASGAAVGSGAVVAGFLGAGNFTGRTLLPAMRGLPVRLRTIVSGGGVSGAYLAKKFGFEQSSTDAQVVLGDASVNAVFITTRHNAHARQVLAALAAGKHVFVEKPLSLTLEDLAAIQRSAEAHPGQVLMLGFNRRFSPHTQAVKRALVGARGPKTLIFTANAGAIPANHWTQDPAVGGGRIVGEACHYIDLLRYLVGSPIVRASVDYLGGEEGKLHDTASIQLMFADGSVGTVHYFANGDKGFPKERLEVFASGKIVVVDNFRKTSAPGMGTLCKGWRQDKGHAAEVAAFVEVVARGGAAPIPLGEILEVSRVAIELAAKG
jgi:predicted dehydrogenase/threonine dehydrogenase-like Zn-dependent dehydrogenase